MTGRESMAGGHDVPTQTALFYSHDAFGLGHLSRTLYLASELRARRPDLDIVVVTSSPAAHTMEALEDFAWVKLPSVTKTGAERYRPYRLSTDLQRVIALRSALLLTTVQQMSPDLVIVDHRPLGLKGEARQALEWIRRHLPATRVVLRDSDRDIIRVACSNGSIPGHLVD
jgi:predicted glycosyltransferase